MLDIYDFYHPSSIITEEVTKTMAKGEQFMTDYNQQLEDLKNGVIESITIQKEDFLDFRTVLIAREDFKHFRGTAYHLGLTVYTYTEEPSK